MMRPPKPVATIDRSKRGDPVVRMERAWLRFEQRERILPWAVMALVLGALGLGILIGVNL